jgi:hypothetical protein
MDLNDLINFSGLDNRSRILLNLLVRRSTSYYSETESDFWNPVIVSIPDFQIAQFEEINIHSSDECLICTYEFNKFKKLPCCKKYICTTCTYKCFGQCVKCPFCKKDIRELIN